MKTCPNCGAENRSAASECRLCATPLVAGPPTAESRQPAAPIQPATPALASAGASPSPAAIVCPDCGTENEAGWAFCQGCGKKLESVAAQAKPAASGNQVDSSPTPSKPDTGRVSRPAATKFDEPAPAPPVDAVPPTVKQPVVQGGPASRMPQGDPKPAGAPSVAAGQAPPIPVPQAPPAAAPQAQAAEVEPSWKTVAACVHCGAAIPAGAQFCAGCGKPLGGAAVKKATGGAVIEVVTEGGKIGDVYPVIRGDLIIGRIEGDVTFPHDGYMSSRHARIVERDGRYYLSDESSRNGTFVRIRNEVELKPGDTFLVGKQVLKFDKK